MCHLVGSWVHGRMEKRGSQVFSPCRRPCCWPWCPSLTLRLKLVPTSRPSDEKDPHYKYGEACVICRNEAAHRLSLATSLRTNTAGWRAAMRSDDDCAGSETRDLMVDVLRVSSEMRMQSGIRMKVRQYA
eukprot:6190870-Pleurochrysis_carterae.AAC.1